jgi:hypothetical protein
MTRLCVALAEEEPETLARLAAESVALEENPNITHVQRLHSQALIGARIMHAHGFGADGDISPLPYDPNDAPEVNLRDEEHGLERTVQLPDATAIRRRIIRQVTNFYCRIPGVTDAEAEVMVNEILAAIGITRRES